MANVLVVDDDVVSRDLLSLLLESEGHSVSQMANSSELTNFKGPVDILISDYLLKDSLDGIDVARALRLTFPEIKIIFLTGISESSLREHIDFPIEQIFEKPVDIERLVAIVEKLAP